MDRRFESDLLRPTGQGPSGRPRRLERRHRGGSNPSALTAMVTRGVNPVCKIGCAGSNPATIVRDFSVG